MSNKPYLSFFLWCTVFCTVMYASSIYNELNSVRKVIKCTHFIARDCTKYTMLLHCLVLIIWIKIGYCRCTMNSDCIDNDNKALLDCTCKYLLAMYAGLVQHLRRFCMEFNSECKILLYYFSFISKIRCTYYIYTCTSFNF